MNVVENTAILHLSGKSRYSGDCTG